MPAYLQKAGWNLTPGSAAFHAVFWFYVGSFLGIAIGARTSDRCSRSRPGIRLTIMAVGMAISAPAMAAMVYMPNLWLCCLMMFLFGVGGVGSWCAEALIRSGVQHLTIVDSDCVEPSNLNRQLMATVHTLGQPKVEALRQHLLSLNPQADILPLQRLYTAETSADFSLDSYDFIIDCIDSLPHKLHLILTATALPSRPMFLSSMGAARKIEPAAPRVAEFWKVEGCPLARALRTKMKKEGQFPRRKFRCVYAPGVLETSEPGGTMMHVTAQFGLTLAGLVLKELSTVNS